MVFMLTVMASIIFARDDGRPERITAKSVIARYVEAKGGQWRLARVLNYSISGSIRIVNEDETTDIAKFQIYQTEGRAVTRIILTDGTVMSDGTDGKIAWSISEHGHATILQGKAAADYIRHHQPLHESLAWPSQFEKISYAGRKSIDGIEVEHLMFVASDNRQINRYFATDTGLLVREEQFVGGAGNSFQVTEFSDYQKCPNGILVARNKTVAGDRHWFAKTEWRVENVRSNIDDIQQYLNPPEAVSKLLAAQKLK